MEFEEVREYVHGDNVRDIDWRVTARTTKPHLKVFREEKDHNIILCIDKNAYMNFGTRKTFKSVIAAQCCALLGFAGHYNKDKIGGIIFGDIENNFIYHKPSSSRKSLWQILKLLSQPTNNNTSYLIDEILFKIDKICPKSATIFIISDLINIGSEFEKAISLSLIHI